MAQKPDLKGVSSVTRNGVQYWYARTAAGKVFCGKADYGWKWPLLSGKITSAGTMRQGKSGLG
jgi:hypothetical protein